MASRTLSSTHLARANIVQRLGTRARAIRPVLENFHLHLHGGEYVTGDGGAVWTMTYP
jgi:hypothetical protein